VKSVKKVLLSVMVVSLSGLALDAFADTAAASSGNYMYLGAGIGYSRLDGEDVTNTNGNLTKNNVSWKAVVGNKFNSLLAVEGQYVDFGAARRNTDRIQARGLTADLVMDFIKDSRITPYGKVGALFWQTNNRFSDLSDRQNGTNVTYGLGVRFALSDALALKTEYERFNMDHTTIDNLSATLQYNFL
jgi:OOP family OmpA-OmpF porin